MFSVYGSDARDTYDRGFSTRLSSDHGNLRKFDRLHISLTYSKCILKCVDKSNKLLATCYVCHTSSSSTKKKSFWVGGWSVKNCWVREGYTIQENGDVSQQKY